MLDTRSLELFVDFVRKNPWLPANDPVMMRAFHAYVKVEEEEVPEVEVTSSRSLVHVEAPESPLERRRSGAKNLSDPIYQNAFISEARASMGQPSVQSAQALLGKYVQLTFNVDWRPAKGVLTDVVEDKTPYLFLDNYHERQYPLYAIQTIEELHDPAGAAGWPR